MSYGKCVATVRRKGDFVFEQCLNRLHEGNESYCDRHRKQTRRKNGSWVEGMQVLYLNEWNFNNAANGAWREALQKAVQARVKESTDLRSLDGWTVHKKHYHYVSGNDPLVCQQACSTSFKYLKSLHVALTHICVGYFLSADHVFRVRMCCSSLQGESAFLLFSKWLNRHENGSRTQEVQLISVNG